MTHCPLCLEDENEREADHEHDGVKVCTYHALAAQTGAEEIRERIAAHKEPARPLQLLARIEVPGAVKWLAAGSTPPRGRVVMIGPSSAECVLYADGVALGRVLGIVGSGRDHVWGDGMAPYQTIVRHTDIEVMLDVPGLRPPAVAR